MKIIYVATMHDSSTFKKLFTRETKPIQAAGKYHQLMCEGIVKNGVDLETIALLPINKANSGRKIIRGFDAFEKGVVYQYIPVINARLFKQLFSFVCAFLRVIRQPSSSILVADYLNFFATKGALLAARIRRIKCFGVVTDLPEFLWRDSKAKKYKRILKKFDGFVFLTEGMSKKVDVLEKPFLVLEGHSDSSMNYRTRQPDEKTKVILYAGTLNKRYGILNLCEAFLACHKEDEELHIYGDGDSKETILQYVGKDKNIKYMGNVANDIVVKAELNAHLLVNPRQGNEEFTKYSFPSKTMEYMATGTPVCMYYLPGMPNEYKEYLNLVDDGEPVSSLSKTIRRVLDDYDDALDKAEKGRRFVLEEKNNVKQAKRLIDFISENVSNE